MRNPTHIISGRFLSAAVMVLLYFSAITASAQTVEDVLVKSVNDGYDLEIRFVDTLRYQSHSPQVSGNSVEIRLKPEKLTLLDQNENEVRSNLVWDINSAAPLKEIIFDREDVDSPSLILRFTKFVNFSVKSGADFRSIIIKVVPLQSTAVIASSDKKENSDNLITVLKQSDPKLADLLDKANAAMIDKNYRRAIQYFTKIRDESTGEVRRHIQELLGVAREFNGQLAHAKAEYELYLNEYPDDENSKRVKQRLSALITAAEKPKEKLRAGRLVRAKRGEEWDTRFYGSFSQFYYRDEMTPEDEDALLLRSTLSNDLSLVGRARKGKYDFRAQLVGNYRQDFRADNADDDEFLPSKIYVQGRHSGLGVYGRLGRQSRRSGGVLGRFDGIHAAYEFGPELTFNTVFGYPVDSSDKTKVNSDRQFVGVSVDVGTLWEAWDFNAFYITQDNTGIKEREAIGGEARYFDTTKSLFTLIDYDISYSDINIFMLVANWTLWDTTTFNVSLDYRNSPILTTTNAIQGQGVSQLDDLLGTFTESELFQLAEDRTSKSQSITAGVTQQLNDKWRLSGNLTVSEYDGTPESGGIAAIQGTGQEYFISSQLVGSDVFLDSDTLITGLRYSDTFSAETVSFNGNWRVRVNSKWRINPRVRIDYRKEKNRDNNRWLFRPFLRTDYRFKKWMKVEFDVGYESLDETFSGQSQTTTGYFISLGYRAQF
jgi:hypothetical protein